MISGSEEIQYTPVEAYGVSTLAEGIISGGGGGDATISGGVRFFWVYYPYSPDESPSGFTGGGWYETLDNSPIWYSAQNGLDLNTILNGFATPGGRTDLNDVFRLWKTYVSNVGNNNEIVKNFQLSINSACWNNL